MQIIYVTIKWDYGMSLVWLIMRKRKAKKLCESVVLTDACGEGGIRDVARITQASVAANGVQTPSVQTHAMYLAFIDICE